MEKTLQVWLPYPKTLITQRFGDNANISYSRDGLKGHTAYDWGADWGAAIYNCTKDAYCYSLMHKDNPDPSLYRAVFMIVETEAGTYEISYGHCSEILAEVGKTYQVGDTIARVGNTGDVFVGEHEVTKAERLAGSHAGAHLHGPQIRPVRKVPAMNRARHYLSNENGPVYRDGFYYEVINFENGYNGCVSLRDFSTEQVADQYVPPAPAADPVTAEVIAEVPHVIEQIQTLPVQNRSFFYTILQKILAALRG